MACSQAEFEDGVKIFKNQAGSPKITPKINSARRNYCRKPDLEETLHDLFMENRCAEYSISAPNIIDKAISLDPNFKYANEITLRNCVYQFMKRRNLVIRTRNRVSQMRSTATEPFHRDFRRRLMTVYKII